MTAPPLSLLELRLKAIPPQLELLGIAQLDCKWVSFQSNHQTFVCVELRGLQVKLGKNKS